MALEELGPTFIKLGQFASNRPDILPSELIDSLEKLQDSVAPFPSQDAHNIIREELGASVNQLLSILRKTPLLLHRWRRFIRQCSKMDIR